MAAATKAKIREWLAKGKKDGYAFVVVMCDQWDWNDWVVYIQDPNRVNEVTEQIIQKSPDHYRVMECYNLDMDLEQQVNSFRAHNWKPTQRQLDAHRQKNS